jgi:hypothetical protein
MIYVPSVQQHRPQKNRLLVILITFIHVVTSGESAVGFKFSETPKRWNSTETAVHQLTQGILDKQNIPLVLLELVHRMQCLVTFFCSLNWEVPTRERYSRMCQKSSEVRHKDWICSTNGRTPGIIASSQEKTTLKEMDLIRGYDFQFLQNESVPEFFYITS